MECGPIGELMTENGEVMPFMGELSVLMGECREPEGPMAVGLSRDGCIPRWDVGELRGEEVMWPEESVQEKKHKTGNYYFSIFYLFLAFLGQLSANFSFLGGLGPDFTAICYFSSFLQSSWFILSYLTLLQYMSDYLTVILSQLFCLIFCPHFLAIIFISLYYSANF